MRELFTPGIRCVGLFLLFSLIGNFCITFMQNEVSGIRSPILLKKAFDMYALIFLKVALYDIMHKSVENFWMRYSFLLLLVTIIMSQYPLFGDIALLPVSVYQGILTVSLCYAVVIKWETSRNQRWILFTVFLFAGGVKTIFPHYEVIPYIYEMLLLPLLGFFILFVFLTNVHQNLAQKESRVEFLAKNATDILFEYHLKPVPYFAFISPAAEILTGYKQKEFYDNPNLFEEMTVNANRPLIRELFENPEQETLTVKWQKKNGDYIWVEFNNMPICSDGEIYSIEGTIRDITKRKLAEDDLRQSKKAKQIFFSHISHELKTPITSVLGYAKALERDVIKGEEQRKKAINLIISKALILQRLTDDMIQLAKFESHRFSFAFTEVLLLDFFETIIAKQRTVINSAQIHFVYSVSAKAAEKNPKIIVDVERMEQVFTNLVNNAVKFTEKGGEISISCEFDALKKSVIFKVKDTGAGILEKNIPFIFETYFKAGVSKRETTQGSGLGLAIVKEIIKGHQGDIFVESKEGKGSTFIIFVPIYDTIY